MAVLCLATLWTAGARGRGNVGLGEEEGQERNLGEDSEALAW